jgi:hypothetical protein
MLLTANNPGGLLATWATEGSWFGAGRGRRLLYTQNRLEQILDQTASYSMDSVGYFPEIKETEV